MATKQTFDVVVAGKWGGVRTVRVQATTAAKARVEARAFMRLDERVQNVYKG
jgi:hypothetical protein